MTLFSLALHDTNRAHSLSEISLLMHCIQIQHPWTIPVIALYSLTIPDMPGNYFCTNTPRKERRTQTDVPKNHNGRKRTHPKVKTDANGRVPTSKWTLMPCMVLASPEAELCGCWQRSCNPAGMVTTRALKLTALSVFLNRLRDAGARVRNGFGVVKGLWQTTCPTPTAATCVSWPTPI